MRNASQSAFRDALIEAGLLVATKVAGLYGRSATLAQLVTAVDDLVTRTTISDGAERLRFPPVMPREDLEESAYLQSFPHLAGTVFAFNGDERSAAELSSKAVAHDDWSRLVAMTDIALAPAACYASYPALAARGPVPDDGHLVDVLSWCFRHEPSDNPSRMQSFLMREQVRIAGADVVRTWRDGWMERAAELLRSIGIETKVENATDPFFGRRGRMLATTQHDERLKFELVCETAHCGPTALASCNYHRDHLAERFGLRLQSGEVAHSACVGFGLERIALALLGQHGFDPDRWPQAVRHALQPGRP